MSLKLDVIRQQFPALNRPAIFFDNPGGTQIARQSLDRITRYLLETNANHEGAFATSIASDAVLDEAHRALADFYNAASPQEIVFGNNKGGELIYSTITLCKLFLQGVHTYQRKCDHALFHRIDLRPRINDPKMVQFQFRE